MKSVINLIFIVFIIIFVVVGYFWYQRIVETTTYDTAMAQEKVVSREFLTVVNKLRTIKIDTSIFESNVFDSLQNLTPVVQIPVSVGRTNPFLPLQ